VFFCSDPLPADVSRVSPRRSSDLFVRLSRDALPFRCRFQLFSVLKRVAFGVCELGKNGVLFCDELRSVTRKENRAPSPTDST
jgi:hypothetical protein